MRDKVVGFSEAQAQRFCIQLWNGLTIAGRAIWSDPDAPMATQLNGLKWLNEMQHRVWTAWSQPSGARLLVLLDQLAAGCEQAPELVPLVRYALDHAMEHANSSSEVL